MDYETGELFLQNLNRPHDGVFKDNQCFLTETSKNRVVVYDNITTAVDFAKTQPQYISVLEKNDAQNKIWVRGIHILKSYIYVACSQFQDRGTGDSGLLPSHLVVIDRKSLRICDRIWIPTVDNLVCPVLYSILNMESLLE
jgi:hypothetical protein